MKSIAAFLLGLTFVAIILLPSFMPSVQYSFWQVVGLILLGGAIYDLIADSPSSNKKD